MAGETKFCPAWSVSDLVSSQAGSEFTACSAPGLPVRPFSTSLNPFSESPGEEEQSQVSASVGLAAALGGRPSTEAADEDEIESVEARAP